jgi:hypothetical protein
MAVQHIILPFFFKFTFIGLAIISQPHLRELSRFESQLFIIGRYGRAQGVPFLGLRLNCFIERPPPPD